MKVQVFRFVAATLTLVGSVGICSTAFAEPATVLTLRNLTVANHNENALRKAVQFETLEKESISIVWWEAGKGEEPQLAEWDKTSLTHEFILRYLKAETTYEWYAESHTAKSEVQAFTTDALPADFPKLKVVGGESSAYPGYVLANNEAKPAMLYIVDNEANIRWYYLAGDYCRPFNLTSRGTILGIRDHNTAFEIDRDGNEIWATQIKGANGPEPLHHEIMEGPNGTFYTLGKTTQTFNLEKIGGKPNQAVITDRIIQFDPTGKVHWDWSLFRAEDPANSPTIFQEEIWGHANGLALDSEGNVAISFRLFDQVWLINPRSSEVMARIGTKGDIEPDANGHFLRQHTPIIGSNGELLVFDNGQPGIRSNSRIVRLKPNFHAKTAETTLLLNIPQFLSSEKRGSVVPVNERQYLVCSTGASSIFLMSQREVILWRIDSDKPAYRALPIKILP